MDPVPGSTILRIFKCWVKRSAPRRSHHLVSFQSRCFPLLFNRNTLDFIDIFIYMSQATLRPGKNCLLCHYYIMPPAQQPTISSMPKLPCPEPMNKAIYTDLNCFSCLAGKLFSLSPNICTSLPSGLGDVLHKYCRLPASN